MAHLSKTAFATTNRSRGATHRLRRADGDLSRGSTRFGIRTSLASAWLLPPQDQLYGVATGTLLGTLLDLGSGLVPAVLSALVQQTVALLLLSVLRPLVLHTTHRQPGAGSFVLLMATLLAAQVGVGQSIGTCLPEHIPLIERLLFWTAAGCTWIPAHLYLLVQNKVRLDLLAEARAQRALLGTEREALRQQRLHDALELRAALRFEIRPRLLHIQRRLATVDDELDLSTLIDQLRACDSRLRPLLTAGEPTAPPPVGHVQPRGREAITAHVRRPNRSLLIGQLLLALAAAPFIWRLDRGAAGGAVAFGVLVDTATLAALTLTARLRTLVFRRPFVLRGIPGICGLIVVAVAAASGAVFVQHATPQNAASIPAVLSIAVAVGLVVEARELLRTRRPRGRRIGISAGHFAARCAVCGFAQAALVLNLNTDLGGITGACLAAAALSVPAGFIADASATIATRNRRLDTALRHLHLSRQENAERLSRTRSDLAPLTHNPVQSRITTAAMSLDFVLDGMFTLEDIRHQVIAQLDLVLDEVDRLAPMPVSH